MIVADILMWFLLIAGAYIVIIGYWLASQGLFPQYVDRCRRRVQAAPLRRLGLGLVCAAPTAVAGAILLRAPSPVLKFSGAVLLLLLVLAGLVGSAGVAAQAGLGLATPGDGRESWRLVLRGGLVMGLTFILPVIGWLLILPSVLLIGVGAALLALRRPPGELVAAGR